MFLRVTTSSNIPIGRSSDNGHCLKFLPFPFHPPFPSLLSGCFCVVHLLPNASRILKQTTFQTTFATLWLLPSLPAFGPGLDFMQRGIGLFYAKKINFDLLLTAVSLGGACFSQWIQWSILTVNMPSTLCGWLIVDLIYLTI